MHFVTYIVKFSDRSKIKVQLPQKVMDIRWKKLFFKVGVWVALEAFFGYMGVDTIADYSEYIFDRHNISSIC